MTYNVFGGTLNLAQTASPELYSGHCWEAFGFWIPLAVIAVSLTIQVASQVCLPPPHLAHVKSFVSYE